jgi:hypothetical protein
MAIRLASPDRDPVSRRANSPIPLRARCNRRRHRLPSVSAKLLQAKVQRQTSTVAACPFSHRQDGRLTRTEDTMSAHIADYVLMQNRNFLCTARMANDRASGNRGYEPNQLTFQLPSNAVLDEPSINRVRRRSQRETRSAIDYEIAINGQVTSGWETSVRGVKRGLWKVVSGGVLREGNSNIITFTTTHVEIPSTEVSDNRIQATSCCGFSAPSRKRPRFDSTAGLHRPFRVASAAKRSTCTIRRALRRRCDLNCLRCPHNRIVDDCRDRQHADDGVYCSADRIRARRLRGVRSNSSTSRWCGSPSTSRTAHPGAIEGVEELLGVSLENPKGCCGSMRRLDSAEGHVAPVVITVRAQIPAGFRYSCSCR